MSKKTKRCTFKRIACLAGAIITTLSMLTPASAAEPDVDVDESVYINLDYYGRVTDTSIVKGCDLNGKTEFTDYGTYDRVINMTNHEKPVFTDDGVKWSFGEDIGRFYYECKPKKKDALIPWFIDVSYSLNGKPVQAQTLAGASGLVQVDIDITPNEDIPDYYKNNMILLASVLVDTEDVYSFRADGAQIQSIGQQKAAIFIALPREETSFSYQIGTDSFESYGTIFVSIPVTMSQMEEMQDIRDAKERIENAADAMDAILNITLDSLGSVSGGLRETQAGIRLLDEARQKLHDSKAGLDQQNNKLMSSMSGLSSTLRKLAQNVNDNEDAFNVLSHHFDTLSSGMGSAQKNLRYVNRNMADIKSNLSIIETSRDPLEVTKAANKIQELSQTLENNLQKLKNAGLGDDMQGDVESMKAALITAMHAIGTEDQSDAAAEAKDVIGQMLSELRVMSANMTALNAASSELSDEIAEVLDRIDDTGVTSSLVRVLSSSGYLMDNLHNFDLYIQETMDDCEGILNSGLEVTMSGLDSTLESAAASLDRTGEIRSQKDIIKKTMEDEWDRLEGDLNVLDIDVNADRPSFTSSENAAPTSIQIIMRTQEISIPSDEKGMDMEVAELPDSVWERIAQIFIKIWNAIISLFQ